MGKTMPLTSAMTTSTIASRLIISSMWSASGISVSSSGTFSPSVTPVPVDSAIRSIVSRSAL